MNCICDHPYYTNPYGNEYYFWHDGGPTYPTYDVWTGCDVSGHYGTPNPYYNYDWANYDFESGTGGYYMPTGSFYCNWQSQNFRVQYVDSGTYVYNSESYDGNPSHLTYGYRLNYHLTHVNISPAIQALDPSTVLVPMFSSTSWFRISMDGHLLGGYGVRMV